MTLFFKLLYHQFAWTYDLVAYIVSFGQWKNWVWSISDQLEPTPTLELGFGPGHLQQYLARQDMPIFGLDLSPQMSRITHRRLRKANLTPRIILTSSTTIPLTENAFDQVIATFPSEYLLVPQTISEIRRVLKPGGRLIILAMARITGKSLPYKIMDAIYRLTGQTVELEKIIQARMLQPFLGHGFQITTNTIQAKNASLTYLEAVLSD